MSKHGNMEEKLWDYIDENITPQEQAFISKLIESDQEWKDKYNELMELHRLMQESIEAEGPSMRFTRNVMEEIARTQLASTTKSYINGKIIMGITSLFMLSLGSLIIYGTAQINWSNVRNPNQPVDLKIVHIDYSKVFNNAYVNIFIMVNIVLAFVLLDMYLTKRKQAYQSK
ncbi:MAG: hypothetical protein ABIN67_12745 [Ferruginibacter sp.]